MVWGIHNVLHVEIKCVLLGVFLMMISILILVINCLKMVVDLSHNYYIT